MEIQHHIFLASTLGRVVGFTFCSLYHGERAPVLIVEEVEWAPETVLTFWGELKFLGVFGIESSLIVRTASSLGTILTELPL